MNLTCWEPQTESSEPTPAALNGNDANTINNTEAPEKKLTLFALRLAILEKSASSIGALEFIWATVVLLGGFAGTLSRTDFCYVTIILLIEGTRIFSRSHELEWQHQATWTLEGAGCYSIQVLHSSSRIVHRVARTLCIPFSAIQSDIHHNQQLTHDDQRGRGFLNHVIQDTTQRRWHSPDVPLVPYAGWVFFSKNVSWLYSWLQVSSAIACVTLSLIRLVKQGYGAVKEESTNWKLALNLFYGMALAEALIFLVEKTYWVWKFSSGKLLEQVSQDCELGTSGVVSTRRFFYDAYSKCISGSIFDGLKMDLVTFAEELLDSDFHDEQLIGARILQSFVRSNRTTFETLRKIGSSMKVIERLIEMLNWKNRGEEEIRRCAAEIVSKLAGKRQNALRIAGIPGSLESISSLLHKGRSMVQRNHESNWQPEMDDESDYDFSYLNNLGLLILKKLSNDYNNCEKIGNARGILPRTIDFTSTRQSLLCNEHAPASQIKAVKRSLQLVKILVSTTGSTGKMLRKEISEIVFTVSSIREILQYGDKHLGLQKLGIEILTNLGMDETAKERIGSTGGIIKLLLSIFFREGITYEEAGEALTMLALESKKNCIVILKETDVLERLVFALNDPLLRLNSLRILRNLFAYSGTESSGRLRRVTAALPTVSIYLNLTFSLEISYVVNLFD